MPSLAASAGAAVPPPHASSVTSSQREHKSLVGDDNASTASSWIGSNTNNSNSHHPNVLHEEGDEYFVPIRDGDDQDHPNSDAARRQKRRARRKRQQQQHEDEVAAEQQNHHHPTAPPQPSLSDRLTSSAVSGTLGLLRLASDVTLSTTGKLVAPPLQATQYLLLPALYAALVDFLSSITSQRVKDWFRILQASVYHLVTVLQSTPAGQAFRQEVVQVGSDIVECVSSDTSRQVIADAMACLVKFSETLHTPQMKALLDQLGVLSCRCIDAASSGRNKQLWLDLWSTIWSGTAVLADPATTMALAEVTAHLCHALEMEEAVHRKLVLQQLQENQQQQKGTAAQRRYRRNQYQAAAYVHPDLTMDPDTTVEDVIVSSLGDVAGSRSSTTTTVTRREIPQQVTLTTVLSQHGDEEDDDDVLDHEVPPPPQKQQQQPPLYNHIPAKAREETVDVAYLRECIQQRNAERDGSSDRRPAIKEDPWLIQKVPSSSASRPDLHVDQGRAVQHKSKEKLDDLEELVSTKTTGSGILKSSHASTKTGVSQRPRKPVVQHVSEDEDDEYDDDEDEDDDHFDDIGRGRGAAPPAKIKEAPVAQFYRILDEILTEKRQDAIQAMLDQAAKDDEGNGTTMKDHADAKVPRDGGQEGGRVWYPQAAAAAGAGNERGQATIRHQLSQLKLRGGSTVGLGYSHRRRPAATMIIPSKYKVLVLGAIAAVLMFGTVWFGLGCYGIYKLIYPQRHGESGGKLSSPPTTSSTIQSSPPPPASSSSSQEIVVRIIREVVHVNAADGSILDSPRGDAPPPTHETFTELNEKAMDQIAECVAAATTSTEPFVIKNH